MAVFTAIGTTLLGSTLATAAGAVGTAAVGAAAAGLAATGVAAIGGAFGGGDVGDVNVPSVSEQDTGALTESEARKAASRDMFRRGVLFTGAMGLTGNANTSSAKLR